MVTVKSKDLERVKRLHKKYPRVLRKAFPITAREETKELRNKIMWRAIGANWSEAFKFTKDQAKASDLTSMPKTKEFFSHNVAGILITPRHMGSAVLHELGSYKSGKRFRRAKSGRIVSTGVLKPNPVYGPSWAWFRISAKNDIQRSFIKATEKIMDREIRKAGLK